MLEGLRRKRVALMKRPLRRVMDILEAPARTRVLRRCVEVLRTWSHAEDVDPLLLQDLRRAWGNEAFSADLDFLAQIARRVLEGPGPFLECGSGLSTVVAAALADQHASSVWRLEQHQGWYTRLHATFAALGIGNAELWYAPLRKYRDFVWFDLQDRRLPSEFSHVFCDGPAVFASDWEEPFFSSWRAGVVPVLAEVRIHFGEILLDDASGARDGAVLALELRGARHLGRASGHRLVHRGEALDALRAGGGLFARKWVRAHPTPELAHQPG